jgi:hydroxymethylpyrimidine pyrophosphatase-like HAD family hydrolase
MSFSTQRFLTTTSTMVRRSSFFYQGDIQKWNKLLFPSPPPSVEIRGKRPFTRSSIPKGVLKEQYLPETPMHKKKGKGIEKYVEEEQETPIHKIKGKGTKRTLERNDEIPMKDCEKTMKNKEEVVAQEKNHKGKGFEKADETCKENIVQMEEKDEKNPDETAHVPNPLGI